MKNLIGLKELRKNANIYISEVQKGKSFIVMRRSKPIFKLVPPDDAGGMWETVADFTEFYKNGIPARLLLKKIRSLNGKA